MSMTLIDFKFSILISTLFKSDRINYKYSLQVVDVYENVVLDFVDEVKSTEDHPFEDKEEKVQDFLDYVEKSGI